MTTGEESPAGASAAAASPAPGGASWTRRLGPGLAVCVALAAIAYAGGVAEQALIGHALIEGLVIAIVLGVALRNVGETPPWIAPGARLASKQVLEVSVFLLGASVDVRAIVNAGSTLFALIVGSVAAGLIISWLVGHLALGLPSKLAVLVGVGNSICGNSAVAAVAPVIRASSNDVATAIGISAIMGLGQILLLPLLVPGLGLTHYQYGVVAGLSVYAVPQVVAAAFIVSNLSGQVATLVKLVRVLLLGPVILVLGFLHRGERALDGATAAWHVRARTYLPWFVAGFLLLAAARTAGVITPALGTRAQGLSSLLFLVAMVGLGFGVDLRHVRAVGPRVAAAVLASMGFMVVASLAGTALLNLRG